MNRFKDWCFETVRKTFIGQVIKEEKHEELPNKIPELGTKLDTAKNGHSCATMSPEKHICKACNVLCIHCVSLRGSCVDKSSYCNDGPKINKSNTTIEISTQTEMLIPHLEVSAQDIALPDLLITSESLKTVAPPPPPPPPPPLPELKQRQKQATRIISVKEKKQIALKKSQSAGVPVAPDITVELLKNVKLRKLRDDVKDLPHSNFVHATQNGGTCAQPVGTLDVLQKVTLRRTQICKTADLDTSMKKSESSGDMDSGTESRTCVSQNLRKTHIARSPGGTPHSLKRRKQPAKDYNFVLCKKQR